MKRLLACLLMGLAAGAAAPARADTALGDWGHFLWNIGEQRHNYFNNPEGRAFRIGLHYRQCPAQPVGPTVHVRVIGPAGDAVVEGEYPIKRGECVLDIPAGAKGVYRLGVVSKAHVFWVSSTLAESVLFTGNPGEGSNAIDGRFAAVFQASVPRTWWFYVPADIDHFRVIAQRAAAHMSQREDWGYFIISPRGQRIRAMWGQPPHTPQAEYQQDMIAEVPVEPGSGGRFWAIQVGLGDSHTYSQINFCLDGVPPYIARSPEEWFDPKTGKKPAYKVYDDDPFLPAPFGYGKERQRWLNVWHFSPCPSLGDQDGVHILGDATFALWNPDGRDLQYGVSCYLPRGGFDDPDPDIANVEVVSPDGKKTFEFRVPIRHSGPNPTCGDKADILPTKPGVNTVRISGVERWYAYTYPATPLVLTGVEADGWKRFNLTAGSARNWYFHVPEGTETFAVHASARHSTDVMNLAVNAPDRTLAMIYSHAGEVTVTVPPGLDGKIWHLRIDVGSASRMSAFEEPFRYQDMELTLSLRGVPGYLAPTWEQWFNPGK